MSSPRGSHLKAFRKLGDVVAGAVVGDRAAASPRARAGGHSEDRRARSSGRADRQPSSADNTSSSKRGAGRPRTDDKHRRILDAALKVFAAKGFHGTSVPEVSSQAGVATGTLYLHFKDKHDLVNQVYRDAKLRLKTALLDGLVDPDM